MANAKAEAAQVLKLRLGRGALEPELERRIGSLDGDSITWLCSHEHWAVRACGLVSAREYLKTSAEGFEACSQACLDNLEHETVKTRLETVELLAVLASVNKEEAWSRFGDELVSIARKNIALDLEERGMEAERNGMAETKQDDEERNTIPDGRLPIELEIERTTRYSAVCVSEFRGRVRANSSGASARIRLDSGAVVLMVHESVGWKALETSLKGINKLIRTYGIDFVADGLLSSELVSLFDDVVAHQNRFVREVGLQLADTLSSITGSSEGDALNDHMDVREGLYHAIADGMCDANGQVRFAACCAARSLVRTRGVSETELLETILAPVVCLNRHYNAEGVRTICQETWMLAFPQGAAPVIAKRAETFIEVYLAEMKASKDDLAREAACHALGELAAKVACGMVQSYAEEIVTDLIAQMQDSSWSVRTACCTSSTRFVTAYPEVLKLLATGNLVAALLEGLTDSIWSVRDEAAFSLGALARLFPDQIFDNLLVKTAEWLLRAANHDKKHHHHDGHDEEDLGSGLVFSCCSAEPNVHFSKIPKRDWQYSDGAVRLLRELAIANPAKVDSSPVMAKFAALVEALPRHHARGSALEETAVAAIPAIAQALGKRPFKRYLDPMIPPIIRILCSDRHKTAHAAAITCEFLRRYLGEGIFKARVESCDLAYWDAIERHPPSAFENIRVSFQV